MTKTFGISVSIYIRFKRQVNETFIHFLHLHLKGAGWGARGEQVLFILWKYFGDV